MPRDTLIDRLIRLAETAGPKPALWYRSGNAWKHYTWEHYLEQVRLFAGALLSIGVEPGDGVAIMSNNNPPWVIADVGTMMARGVPTGIYQTCTDEQALYIANHCEARVLVLEHYEFWEDLGGADFVERLEHTQHIVMIRDADRIDHEAVSSFEEFVESGRDHLAAVDDRIEALDEEDLGTLIYTSGTTGHPKGVMLSHRNMAWTAKQGVDVFELAGEEIGHDDSVVSYLPLSHIAEQMMSIHLPLTTGLQVWFCDDLKKVKDVLLVGRPTLFMAVPRVWEKFRNALEERLTEATGIKKRIVDFSMQTLLECGHVIYEQGEEALTTGQRLRYALADRLFASKLKGALGLDRLRLAATGAAPISYDVLEFFLSVGIIIHEVYGQSEDNGPTTYNYPQPGKRKLGSAGIPFPGVDVKIAEDGEILVRGPNVFMGYYKNPEATEETLVDGWLHSGDVGEFDDDGFLHITERKKDLIITAGGKNVAPQKIEKYLRQIEGVGNCVVVGERRKFLSALLTVDPEQGPVMAEARGWPTDPAELAEHPAFRQHVARQLESVVNSELARYETIKKFAILGSDFTVEGGELTPTQKVKRRVIEDKYGDRIDEFYAGLD